MKYNLYLVLVMFFFFIGKVSSQYSIEIIERSMIKENKKTNNDSRTFKCFCSKFVTINEKLCHKIKTQIKSAKKLIGLVGTSDYIIYKAKICNQENSCDQITVISTGVFYYLGKKYRGGKKIVQLFKRLARKNKLVKCNCKE